MPPKTKKCPKGKIINPDTGRCVKKDGKLGKQILAAKKPAKPGKKPAKPKSEKDCPEGKIRNPATGRCVKKDGAVGKSILKKKSPKKLRAEKEMTLELADTRSKQFLEFLIELGSSIGKSPEIANSEIEKRRITVAFEKENNGEIILSITSTINDKASYEFNSVKKILGLPDDLPPGSTIKEDFTRGLAYVYQVVCKNKVNPGYLASLLVGRPENSTHKHFIVATINGDLAGFLLYRVYKVSALLNPGKEGEEELEVLQLADPKLSKKDCIFHISHMESAFPGLDEALVSQGKKIAKEKKCKLMTFTRSQRGYRFFKKMGFKEQKEIVSFYNMLYMKP